MIVTPQRTGLRRTLRMCLYHRSPFLVYCFYDPKLSTYTLTTEINFLGFLVSLTKVEAFGYWFQWTPRILSTSWPFIKAASLFQHKSSGVMTPKEKAPSLQRMALSSKRLKQMGDFWFLPRHVKSLDTITPILITRK